ncbi:MAG: radical SAM protein [archaeon]
MRTPGKKDRFNEGDVFVIAAGKGKTVNAQIATSVFSMASAEGLIAVTIYKKNYTHGLILKHSSFSISSLKKQTPRSFIENLGQASGRDSNKLETVSWKSLRGIPVVVSNAISFATADVIGKFDLGDSTLFLGKMRFYGSVGKGVPLSYDCYRQSRQKLAVRGITLVLTERCNLRCRYCYLKKTDRDMSRKIIRQAVDFLVENTPEEQPVIQLFGGETFLAPELMKFAFEYALKRNRKIRFLVVTNGSLYSQKIARLLKKYRSSILDFRISFDGFQEYHDKNRIYIDGRSSWEDITRNLRHFLKLFPSLCVESRFDARQIGADDMIRAAESLLQMGIKNISFQPVTQSVLERRHGQLFRKAMLRFAKWYFESGKKRGLRFHFFDPDVPFRDGNAKLCGLAESNICVDVNGEIYPCIGFLVVKKQGAGNITDPRMRYRWRLLLMRQSWSAVYDGSKRFFICPAYGDREISKELFTNSLSELPKHISIFKQVAKPVCTKFGCDCL